jgi:hypothetical protein
MAGLSPGDLEDMLLDQCYSDFKIICKVVNFPVHKIILSGGSAYFRMLFNSSFKVNSND